MKQKIALRRKDGIKQRYTVGKTPIPIAPKKIPQKKGTDKITNFGAKPFPKFLTVEDWEQEQSRKEKIVGENKEYSDIMAKIEAGTAKKEDIENSNQTKPNKEMLLKWLNKENFGANPRQDLASFDPDADSPRIIPGHFIHKEDKEYHKKRSEWEHLISNPGRGRHFGASPQTEEQKQAQENLFKATSFSKKKTGSGLNLIRDEEEQKKRINRGR